MYCSQQTFVPYIQVMKILYLDCTGNDEHRSEIWSKDKSVDHLVYPDSYCMHLLENIKQSTDILPQHMRTMDNPAIAPLHDFSVGFIPR